MTTAALLLLGALGLRALGAAAREEPAPRGARILGGALSGLAAWLFAAGAGLWVPPWPLVGVGIVGALIEFRGGSRLVRVAGDVTALALAVVLSVPWPATSVALLAVAAFALLGAGLDWLLGVTPGRVRVILLAGPLLAGLAAMIVAPGLVRETFETLGPFLPFAGVTAPATGERVVLENGSVAWLDRPRDRAPHPGAVLFHGNHPAGSRQKAATVLRRALVGAGWTVLAVDHPGYGESPAPDAGGGPEAWDPVATATLAFDFLQRQPGIGRIAAIGHSLGCSDVMRLLSTGRDPEGAILFGASLPDPETYDEDYWYDRFHSSRRLRDRISREDFRSIRDRYYQPGSLAMALPSGHPEIVSAFFSQEHANIEATREQLHAMLPGAKRIRRIDATHYFHTYTLAGLIVGDTRVTRRMSNWFREYAAELEAR